MCELGLRKNIIWKYLFIEVVLLVSTTNYFQSIYKNGWYIPFTISKLYAIIWKLGWILSVKDTNAHTTISFEIFLLCTKLLNFRWSHKITLKDFTRSHFLLLQLNIIWTRNKNKLNLWTQFNFKKTFLKSDLIFFVNHASSTSIYF
jgi:hypothetical protein